MKNKLVSQVVLLSFMIFIIILAGCSSSDNDPVASGGTGTGTGTGTGGDGNAANIAGYWQITSTEDGETGVDTTYWQFSQGAGEVTGELLCGEEGGQLIGTVNGNTLSVQQGELGIYGNDSGIYGNTFEFEFEYYDPTADGTGTYTVGADFDAIDFENADSQYNLHAYGGTVTITAVSPNIVGTFTLTNFAPDHQDPTTLSGTVSGNFSVPADGSSGGTFNAQGTVAGETISILGTNVVAFKGAKLSGTISGDSMQGTWTHIDGSGAWSGIKLSSAPTCSN